MLLAGSRDEASAWEPDFEDVAPVVSVGCEKDAARGGDWVGMGVLVAGDEFGGVLAEDGFGDLVGGDGHLAQELAGAGVGENFPGVSGGNVVSIAPVFGALVLVEESTVGSASGKKGCAVGVVAIVEMTVVHDAGAVGEPVFVADDLVGRLFVEGLVRAVGVEHPDAGMRFCLMGPVALGVEDSTTGTGGIELDVGDPERDLAPGFAGPGSGVDTENARAHTPGADGLSDGFHLGRLIGGGFVESLGVCDGDGEVAAVGGGDVEGTPPAPGEVSKFLGNLPGTHAPDGGALFVVGEGAGGVEAGGGFGEAIFVAGGEAIGASLAGGVVAELAGTGGRAVDDPEVGGALGIAEEEEPAVVVRNTR